MEFFFFLEVKGGEAVSSSVKGNSNSTVLLFKKVSKISENQNAFRFRADLKVNVVHSPGLSIWMVVSLRKE